MHFKYQHLISIFESNNTEYCNNINKVTDIENYKANYIYRAY